MLPPGFLERVAHVVGPRGYLDRPEDLSLYEYDGGVDKHRPDVVVFPRSTAEVSALMKLAANSTSRWWAAARARDSPAAPFRARAA